jgi:tRNA(Ile)-lysidine synthase
MLPHRTTRLPFFVHRCVRTARAVLVDAGLRDEPVLLGVSGGGDSMALLEIVGLLAPKLRLGLHVACVDHRVRRESAAEAELVREAAARWGATFHPLTIEAGRSDEDTLRRARHGALEELRLRIGCRFTLLGHTSDDQVETIVLRFFRGAGFGGLAGMRAARGPILRPLLAIRRAELRRLLQSRAVAWAEDSTNESDRYARGRLRSGVLPAVEAGFGVGALDHLLDVAPRWRADEDFLEQEASRLLAYASRRGVAGTDLDAEALGCAHAALRARVLRRWLLDATGRSAGSREIAAIERWLESGAGKRGHLDLSGMRLRGAGGRLSLERAGEGSAATAAGTAQSGIDIVPSSDDANVPASTRGADTLRGKRKPVLPPSDGRVRFPRK